MANHKSLCNNKSIVLHYYYCYLHIAFHTQTQINYSTLLYHGSTALCWDFAAFSVT
jgi:hypothetical protein